MKQWVTLTCAVTCLLGACDNSGNPISETQNPAAVGDAGIEHEHDEHEHDDDGHAEADAGDGEAVGSERDGSSAQPTTDAAVDPTTPDAATGTSDPSAPQGKVPAFIAVGNCERRVMTCDGGRSWVQDQVMASGCSTGDFTTDHASHSSSASHAIDYGDGWFVAAWGWGEAGPVLRSRDGVKWEETSVSNDDWFGGVAYGNGRFILGRPRNEGRVSTDGGATWTPLAPQAGWKQDGVYRARATAYVAEGNRFFMQDDADFWSTKTGSGDFTHVSGSSGCFPKLFASGGGVVLGMLNAGQSYICRSTDQGATWQKVLTRGSQDNTPLLYADGRFAFWSDGQMWTSSDGLSWRGTDLKGGTASPTALAYSPDTKQFVAIGGYGANQAAYYSGDGVNWSSAQTFPKGAFLRSMAFGYVDPSPSCPLPKP